MLNPPNSLSLLRAPLALLFIIDNAPLRIGVILLAMLTDCIDGYLARRYRYTSRFGAVLDPIMDKFFVYVVLCVFLFEHQIKLWQAGAMIMRDLFLFLFMFYLGVRGGWKTFKFRSVRWGKVTTGCQFCVIAAILFKRSFPPFLYLFFILFGFLAFIELIQSSRRPAR